eukprot:121802-Amphidinium_carterae.1
MPLEPIAKPRGKRKVSETWTRHPALAEVLLPNGRIAAHLSKSSFECVCHRHEQCGFSRTQLSKKKQGTTVAGRPLGLMAAWLAVAGDFPDKESHTDKSWWEATLTQTVRANWRQQIQEMASGHELLEYERDVVAGEAEEPVSLLGYI